MELRSGDRRVLAVEDSPTQGEVLRRQLVEAGFDVVLAPCAADALRHLRDGHFDLIVSDVVMPNMDGYELCSAIKQHDPDLPVVLLTSLTDPTEIVRGLEAGADNFLRKPYEPSQLVARLHSILFQRELRAEGHVGMGLEVVLRGQRFMITAERQQILGLLISSFEDLVVANTKLRDREEALQRAHRDLHDHLVALEAERQRVVGVLAAVPNATVIVDANGTITDVSEQYRSRFGFGDVIGKPLHSTNPFFDASGAVVPCDRRPLDQALRRGQQAELGGNFDLFVERADGTLTPVVASAAPLLDSAGGVIGAVGSLQELGGLAAHDPVTKLPNHALFTDRVSLALSLAEHEDHPMGVLAVLVDRVARLRLNLPPGVADAVVAEVARRIQGALVGDAAKDVAPGASAAYFGDGLFGILLPSLVDDVDAVRVGRLVHEAVGFAVEVGASTVPVTATVGVAVSIGGGHAVTVVSGAVAAARRATTGAPVQAVDPAVDARAGEELRREVELRAAIERGELEVHYQPTVVVATGEPIGAEALVRWRHPDHGLVGPDQFIPLAEESGLIGELGWWVLRDACRQAARWSTELPGGSALVLSVNLAAGQLADPSAATRVGAALDEAGLDPSALVLEITESGVMADAAVAVERLWQLKSLGVHLAIDDFGTGYSSLLQLRDFPVETLKIDRTFVAGLVDDPSDAAIVAGTIRLAQALGLYTVAEGVETAEQLTRLGELGCSAAQGYLWSAALPAEQFAAWWRAARAAAAQLPMPAGVGPGGALDGALPHAGHELSEA